MSPLQSCGVFVRTHETSEILYPLLPPIVTPGEHSVGLDKRVTTCSRHHGIVQFTVTARNTQCAPRTHREFFEIFGLECPSCVVDTSPVLNKEVQTIFSQDLFCLSTVF